MDEVTCARCAPSRPLGELGRMCPDSEPHKPFMPGVNAEDMPDSVQVYVRTYRPEMLTD